MLDQIIAAYLYREYADDDDLQALVASDNAAAQVIQDWFIENPLPVWPLLSGELLEWTGLGIYGYPKTSIASLASSPLGPLNTLELNTKPLNTLIPSTQTVYALTDDLYQRLLTWHLYRADGRHFSVRWFKRRILRFIVGVNGMDPQPELPGFTIGCENTLAISVGFNNNICTVTIAQTLLAIQYPKLSQAVLAVFSAALETGELEVPAQYSYEVQLTSPFAADVQASVFASGLIPVIATDPVTVSAGGNAGALTYAWTWMSGGADISIDEAAAMTTTFTGTGLSEGQTLSGVAQCVVTDTGSGHTITVTTSVSIMHL